MSAPADRPLSMRDSLAGLLAVFRLLDAQLGVDRDPTTVRIMGAGPKGEELAVIRLSDLIHRSDAALGVADLANRTKDVPGQHAPLPWTVQDGGEIVFDAVGAPVVDCSFGLCVPEGRSQANAALIQRATAAHPLLLTTIQTAVYALRSYQYGNEAPDLAREIADACEAVLTQMEGR